MPSDINQEVPSGEGSYEFECEDCRMPVYRPVRLGGVPAAKCYVCEFAATLPPDEARAVRARLRGEA